MASMGHMNGTRTTVKALSNSFRSFFIVSLIIAVLGIAIAFVTAPGAMDEAIRLSMFLSLVWILAVIFAFVRFQWRALWFLLGAPLSGWWLIVLYLIASGCAHNAKNCP